MSRAKWKNPYVSKVLLNNFNNLEKLNKSINTKSRSSTIIPRFIGYNINVHNGKIFINIKITDNMVGKKLGEFAPKRKIFSFKKKKIK